MTQFSIARSELVDVIHAGADKVVKKLPGSIIIQDNAIIEECAARASRTLAGYNMSGEVSGLHKKLPNHFKEAGHYVYWIRKLKPLRVVDFSTIGEILKRRQVNYNEKRLESIAVKSTPMTSINECIAIYVAKQIVWSAEDFIVSELDKQSKVSDLWKEKFKKNRTLCSRKLHGMTSDMIASLRYDNHSPNTLALLMESMLATDISLDQ